MFAGRNFGPGRVSFFSNLTAIRMKFVENPGAGGGLGISFLAGPCLDSLLAYIHAGILYPLF